jgi:hypothetical protein
MIRKKGFYLQKKCPITRKSFVLRLAEWFEAIMLVTWIQYNMTNLNFKLRVAFFCTSVPYYEHFGSMYISMGFKLAKYLDDYGCQIVSQKDIVHTVLKIKECRRDKYHAGSGCA